MLHRIPVSVVTGFLGSGKTTLLNRVLRDPEAARTAVIVNEFGEIGLDHELVASSDDTVVLLTSGCLCCAVKSDLIATLDDLLIRRRQGGVPPFARVAIETSGLADPSAVIQVLLGDPKVNAHYALDLVVATIDAVNGAATLDRHREAARQVACADRLVLTKTDLLPPGADLALRARLAALNPGAELVAGDGAASLLFGAAAEPRAWPESPSAHHDHDHGIRAFCVVREAPMAEATLALLRRALADSLGPDLLRVKGILNIAEHPRGPAVLHGAQAVLHDIAWLDGWPSADRRSRLVFITQGVGQDTVVELIDMLDRMTMRARRRAAS